MAESKRINFKYKSEWRESKEGRPVKSEFEKQEQITSIAKQIIAAMAAIILTSVIFAWRFADGDYNSMGFQLKIMYIVVVQLLVYPFQGVFLLVGYFHLKEKLYLSGIVIILCSLVYVWLGFHQIK